MISGSSTTESSIAPSACKSTPLLTLTPQIWSTPNQSSGAGSAEKKPACSDALDRMAFKLSFPPEPDFWFYFFCFYLFLPFSCSSRSMHITHKPCMTQYANVSGKSHRLRGESRTLAGRETAPVLGDSHTIMGRPQQQP